MTFFWVSERNVASMDLESSTGPTVGQLAR